ncbi:hypothetical protein ACRAQ7_03890 [Erythrobacter sp. W53]
MTFELVRLKDQLEAMKDALTHARLPTDDVSADYMVKSLKGAQA